MWKNNNKVAACLLIGVCILSACGKNTGFNQTAFVTGEEITGEVTTAELVKNEKAAFDWFEYRGDDAIFDKNLPENQYQNPIIAGFAPDPSITRKGDDYYLVNSSFSYLPGLPIWHSRNLVDWKLIGHALHRAEQLDMTLGDNADHENTKGVKATHGIFALTIRYHDGLFYLITTATYSGGNFLMTAADPAGPWSDPVWLNDVGGIDPDLFFDDDGRVYIVHNNAPEGGSLYDGHRAIWIWEYDQKKQNVIPGSARQIINGGVDLSKKPIWVEGPHIYKVNGWYYLTCAEGGTGENHSQVIFRTDDLLKPFEPYSGNPILTQRDLPIDRDDPVSATGHADFVQAPDGSWWAVFLATRPYNEKFYNIGRETFLLPVSWDDGWPMILEMGIPVPYQVNKPAIDTQPLDSQLPSAAPATGNFTWRDDFISEKVDFNWVNLRSLNRDWLHVEDGFLYLSPREDRLSGYQRPAYLGVRQKHHKFSAATKVITSKVGGVSSGLALFLNEKYHYYLGIKRVEEHLELFLELAGGSKPEKVASEIVRFDSAKPIILEVLGNEGALSFGYRLDGNETRYISQDADGTLLSTEVAGGFLGATIGLHSRVEAQP